MSPNISARKTRSETDAPPELRAKTRRTGRVLSFERLTRRFWPLWTAALFGLALTLAGFWTLWSPEWRAGLLAVSAALLGFLLWRGARGWTSPTEAESLAALDAGLARRAATHLAGDAPALGAETPMGRALWAAHRRRLEAEAAKAKVPAPDLRLSAPDPWGLRYWAILAVIGGFSLWWTGAREQAAGFFNGAPVAEAAPLAAAPARLDAWIAPPPHTRAAPIYLMSRLGQRVEIPTGSVAQFRVAGAVEAPQGAIPGLTPESEGFLEDGPGVYALKIEAREAGPASVSHGGEVLGSWDFAIIPDDPPKVEFAETPRDGRRQALSFKVRATDDYGVTRSWVELRPLGELGPRAAEAAELPSVEVEVDRENRDLRIGEVDLTEHAMVGLEVEAVAWAEDAAGNRGASEPARFNLPERLFSEPMAKAIVEQRRGFLRDSDYGARAQDLLEAAMDYPGDYFKDSTAYLAASVALHRLTAGVDADRAAEARPEVLSLLWKSALRLEEGDLSNAWDALQAAKRRLEEALEQGASEEEIARLTEEMRQAMNDYLDALQQMAENNPEALQNMPGGEGGETTREQLERMLQQMEETARGGARDQAQEMLNMLAEMLENLRPGAQAGGGQGGGEGQGGDAQADALQDMMRRQQELADETFQQGRGQQGRGQQGQGQQGQQGQGGQNQAQNPGRGQGQGGQGQNGQGAGSGGDLAERQGDLRRGLDGVGELGAGETAPEAGAGGDPLDRAREAMERAERALREGDSRSALDAQSDALEALREGARRLAERRAQEQQGRQGQGESAEGGGSRDPFGRPRRSVGPNDGEGVEVPEERARNRALEIQREIRRRSSERDRTLEELDYLNRLQRPF